MRDIKFRGRTSKGEWLHGDLIHLGEYTTVCGNCRELPWNECIVDPDTVGMYTGLKDAQGQEIYEGDHLVICNPTLPNFATVVFKRGAFVLRDREGRISARLHRYSSKIYEIIGNIHDNPGRQ